MKIGVFVRAAGMPSLGAPVARDQVAEELEALGAVVIPFTENDPLPADADLYWDPTTAAASKPHAPLLTGGKPYVTTIHDVINYSVPIRERVFTTRQALMERVRNAKKRYNWFIAQRSCSAVITDTEFVRGEIIHHLGINPAKVAVIPLAVDHRSFVPGAEQPRDYFFHVSNHLPTKNLPRILEAYQRLPASRPPMVALLPGYKGSAPAPDIRIIREKVSVAQLVALYQGARALVFPSLHEGFGLPILEAMACGCPVITSTVTACPEVAGDAALLVDPRSVDAIGAAMWKLAEDANLWQLLHEKGLARAARFRWEDSARAHLKVFEAVLTGGPLP